MTNLQPITVNATHVARYIRSMLDRGYQPNQVLASTGLSNEHLANPEASINARQYQIVITNMLALTGNDSLGSEIGQEIGCTDMGILGYAMMSSPTLRRAINIWFSYNKTLFGTFIESSLTETDSAWTISTDVLLPMGPAFRFCIEEFLLFSRSAGIGLSNQNITFHHVKIPYPRPSHASIYEAFFNCPMHYNANSFEIAVTSPTLDTSVTSQNAELNRTYIDFCDRISMETGGKASIQTQFYNAFLRSPDCLPNMGEMAKKLGMSTRNLQRKLTNEGASYRKLATAFRVEMAKEYLLTTNLSCKEISFQLGFTDTSHFVKIFKANSGTPPEQFRQRNRNNQTPGT